MRIYENNTYIEAMVTPTYCVARVAVRLSSLGMTKDIVEYREEVAGMRQVTHKSRYTAPRLISDASELLSSVMHCLMEQGMQGVSARSRLRQVGHIRNTALSSSGC